MTATLVAASAEAEANLLREIASQLRGLRFGSVEITVHIHRLHVVADDATAARYHRTGIRVGQQDRR